MRAADLHGRGLLPFAQVEQHQQRLAREEAKASQHFFFFGAQLDGAQRLLVAEGLFKALEQSRLALDDGPLAPAALLALFGQALQLALNGDQVVDQQLGIHGGDITRRVDAASRVRHIGVLEAAHHVQKAIHLGQLVEQRARDGRLRAFQAGDIGIGDLGIDGLFGLEHGRKAVNALIRHIHHAGVHLEAPAAGGQRLVAAAEGVENSGLA